MELTFSLTRNSKLESHWQKIAQSLLVVMLHVLYKARNKGKPASRGVETRVTLGFLDKHNG